MFVSLICLLELTQSPAVTTSPPPAPVLGLRNQSVLRSASTLLADVLISTRRRHIGPLGASYPPEIVQATLAQRVNEATAELEGVEKIVEQVMYSLTKNNKCAQR